LIVHSLADVNGQLQRGRPFFMDIVRDGIALYETPGHPFVQPEPLAPAEVLTEAEGFFEERRDYDDTVIPMARCCNFTTIGLARDAERPN
jgi:hypothetical protein